MCKHLLERYHIFNVFTDVLARIWFVLYYGFYYFIFVNFKLLFSKDKERLLTQLLFFKLLFRRNNRIWYKGPACKASNAAPKQTRWCNKITLRRGFQFHGNFHRLSYNAGTSNIKTTKDKIKCEKELFYNDKQDGILENLNGKQKRLYKMAYEKGVWNWLNAYPLKFDLNKRQFWDGISIGYGWSLSNLPTTRSTISNAVWVVRKDD